MINECVLTLIAPPDVEEKLLDHLLIACTSQLFTSHAVACHGAAMLHRNPVEQVLGRTLAIRVEIRLEFSDANVLLQTLREEFQGAGLHYWLSPVTAGGTI